MTFGQLLQLGKSVLGKMRRLRIIIHETVC